MRPKAEVREGTGDDLANGGFDEWDSCGGQVAYIFLPNLTSLGIHLGNLDISARW